MCIQQWCICAFGLAHFQDSKYSEFFQVFAWSDLISLVIEWTCQSVAKYKILKLPAIVYLIFLFSLSSPSTALWSAAKNLSNKRIRFNSTSHSTACFRSSPIYVGAVRLKQSVSISPGFHQTQTYNGPVPLPNEHQNQVTIIRRALSWDCFLSIIPYIICCPL